MTFIPRADLYPAGRKFCSGCKRWRLHYEFGPQKAGILRGQCNTCERVRNRIRIGIKNRGRPYAQAQPYGPTPQEFCQRGHPMKGENLMMSGRKRRCRTCYRIWQNSPKRREYARIWEDAKRREAGIPRRNLKRTLPEGRGEVRELAIEPFREWLEKLVESVGVGRAQRLVGVDKRHFHRLRREIGTVHIDVVDAALTRVGGAFLWDLYPALYEDEKVAA